MNEYEEERKGFSPPPPPQAVEEEQHAEHLEYDATQDDLLDPEPLAQQAAAIEQARALRNAIKSAHGSDQLREAKAGWPAVQRQWRRWFEPLNLARTYGPYSADGLQAECIQRSPTDMAFMALCYAWHDSEDEWVHVEQQDADGMDVSWIQLTSQELILVATQHTVESAREWPSPDYWQSLKRRVAAVIITYFDTGYKEFPALVSRLTSTAGALEQSQLNERYLARKRPPLLRKEKADAKAALRKKREAEGTEWEEEDDERSNDVSVEAGGSLWRDTSEEIVGTYVRLASRVVYVVDLQNEIKTKFPCKPAPTFQLACHRAVDQWVYDKCRREQQENVMKLFRDLANTWWQPLGSETHRWRAMATRQDKLAPQQLLDEQLGVEITQHMHHRTLVRVEDIAASHPNCHPPHPSHSQFWPPLFLALLATDMQTVCELDLLDSRSGWLIWQAHTLQSRYRIFWDERCTPLIVQIQRRWCVHYRGVWYECGSGPGALVHAVLCWLHFIDRDGRKPTLERNAPLTESGESVETWIRLFLFRGQKERCEYLLA